MKYSVILLILLSMPLFSCDTTINEGEETIGTPIMETPMPTVAPTPTTMPTPPPLPTPTPAPMQVEFMELLNDARSVSRMCGDVFRPAVSPMKEESRLNKAALGHSDDMFENNFFSHVGSDGSTVRQRVEETGYPAGSVGEAIALGYPTNEKVLDGWLNSPPHCNLIMSPVFTEFGLGEIGRYWTLDLANRR